MTVGIPSARLGGLYALYFAIVALSVGWFGPFFASLGFSSAQIGIAIGVLTGSKVIAPYFWGWLGDLLPNRLRVVQVGMLGSTIAALGLFLPLDFVGLCLVLAAFGLFWNAIIAQFDTLTLAYLGEHPHRYTRIRVWGSIGFIWMMLAAGWAFTELPFSVLPAVMVFGLLLSGLLSLSLPPLPAATTEAAVEGRVTDRLKMPAVWLFFAIVGINQFAHGPLNVFFTLYLQDHGHSAWVAGQLWALGVLAEVVLFFVLPHWLSRLDLRVLLTVSLALAAGRWLGTGFAVESITALIVLQLVHGFSFGVIHAISIEFVRRWFPGRLSGRGMALYSGLVFGLGGSLGAFASGYLWSSVGGASTFLSMSALSAIAACCAFFGLRNGRLEASESPR